VCTTRIVLNLEKMVVKEAQRAFTYLSLYDYLTDLVVVNRVLPPEVTDTYFDSWRGAQQVLVDGGNRVLTSTLRTKLFRPRDRRARTRSPRWANRSMATVIRRRSSITPCPAHPQGRRPLRAPTPPPFRRQGGRGHQAS